MKFAWARGAPSVFNEEDLRALINYCRNVGNPFCWLYRLEIFVSSNKFYVQWLSKRSGGGIKLRYSGSSGSVDLQGKNRALSSGCLTWLAANPSSVPSDFRKLSSRYSWRTLKETFIFRSTCIKRFLRSSHLFRIYADQNVYCTDRHSSIPDFYILFRLWR